MQKSLGGLRGVCVCVCVGVGQCRCAVYLQAGPHQAPALLNKVDENPSETNPNTIKGTLLV